MKVSKYIEEIAKIEIGAILEKVNMGDGYADINSLADQIYHIVIPEGSVVLTEEELELYRQTIITSSQEYTKICNEMGDKIINARKQAIKEVLNRIYTDCIECEERVLEIRKSKDDEYYKGFSVGMTNTKMYCKELAKEFRAYIGE